MFKKIISVILVFISLIPSAFNSFASELSVSAKAACLINCDTGDVVFEKNANERLPMASTTKIMTCLVALESSNLSDIVTVDSRAVGTEGSSLYLEKGDFLTLEDLLYAVMLRSANDAAAAVAYYISGSIEDFASLMNEKAKSLDLCNTHFKNPHGLSDENHYTSACDFAKLAAYAMKNKDFAKIVSSKTHTVKLNESKERFIANHNRLLSSYEGATGIKTGFTKASGRCLVSSATRNGVSFVAVTLGAPDDWNDHKKMLDLGFSEYSNITLFEEGELFSHLNVAGHGEVKISNKEKITLVMKNGSDVTEKIFAKHLSFAPISTKSPSGKAEIYINGNKAYETELYAESEIVEEITEESLLQKISSFFKKVK